MPYVIKDWDKHFENAQSRKVDQLQWVPTTTGSALPVGSHSSPTRLPVVNQKPYLDVFFSRMNGGEGQRNTRIPLSLYLTWNQILTERKKRGNLRPKNGLRMVKGGFLAKPTIASGFTSIALCAEDGQNPSSFWIVPLTARGDESRGFPSQISPCTGQETGDRCFSSHGL